MTRVAVVGHVEWVEFARVDHVPAPGEIVHAVETWQEPAGGGAVAAVQLTRLAGECLFLTALGDDEVGHRAAQQLGELGVRVEAAWRPGAAASRLRPRRRGRRADDAVIRSGWARTAATRCRGTSSRSRRHVLHWRRRSAARGPIARRLVATPRANEVLVPAHVQLDVLVRSARDPGERYVELDPRPRYVAQTDGAFGGSLVEADGTTTRWDAAPLPGPAVDAYGAGDSFRRFHLRACEDLRPKQ